MKTLKSIFFLFVILFLFSEATSRRIADPPAGHNPGMPDNYGSSSSKQTKEGFGIGILVGAFSILSTYIIYLKGWLVTLDRWCRRKNQKLSVKVKLGKTGAWKIIDLSDFNNQRDFVSSLGKTFQLEEKRLVGKDSDLRVVLQDADPGFTAIEGYDWSDFSFIAKHLLILTEEEILQ